MPSQDVANELDTVGLTVWDSVRKRQPLPVIAGPAC
jgi:hypothetical protein